MADKKVEKVAIAVGAALAGSFAIADVASADTGVSPFAMTTLSAGYMLTLGEGSCGEGKCGGDKEGEGSCGGDKGSEGSCGEGKCGGDKGAEGSCGGDKDAEGKCGEGKCGGSI